MAESIVRQKSYDFALQEALAGQSRKDFFAKMSIASKEARESNYWLRLLKDSGISDTKEVQELLEKSDVLIRILTSIVKTGSEAQRATRNSKLRTQN